MPRIADLRRHAIARSLFAPTTLRKAVAQLGFVQADPIRAPARAQDLILRHRVRGYRAADLERHYHRLPVEEEFFVNYGFLPRAHQTLLHPRTLRHRKGSLDARRMDALLQFAAQRGHVHPREAAEHFAHGRARNYWGGDSNVTTQLLDLMHFAGQLRVVRRDNGIRVYAVRAAGTAPSGPTQAQSQADALLRLAAHIYAPLPAATLTQLAAKLRGSAPQLAPALARSLARAPDLLAHATVDGVLWYWPAGEHPRDAPGAPAEVRLLAPFDPVVWDRRRFECFWGWGYRFEAYTPATRRKLGYYALPLLWRERVIGWANVTVANGRLLAEPGYVAGRPPGDRAYGRELEAELVRMADFLRVGPCCGGN